METQSRGKIGLGREIGLILFSVGVVSACTVSVVQPGHLEVDYTHQAVTIECSFFTTDCPPEKPVSLWFRYGAHQTETLCLDRCSSETDKFTVTETLIKNQVSLTINRVASNDSAIYICGIAFPSAAAPGAKQTGKGTVLVVRESKLLSKEVQSLLTVLLALLSIYITVVCVVFIVLSKSKCSILRNKRHKEDSQKKSARRVFQEIAQELYHKRHMERSQQAEKEDPYENRSALFHHQRP